ncbi:spore coat protein U domain-containing protein [Rivibacter subsaxonicus]|uniref:Spore coat protein U-like protein n=1 Tax=Rivibacter subsaxonicus TaxID=457575 RepID=A0A4Q7VCL5_9BURK|nr:spore coat protein U domain-containing protein [Rivibacter subsaxonicus]RZT93604.1 spore coat protein U-like protein [Rivibacter subsaxonicus]
MRALLRLCGAALLLAQAVDAHAAHSCTVAVGTLAFGAYTGTQNNSSATMTIRCTRVLFDARTLNYSAALSTGAGTFAQRRLTKAPDTLNYNLYLTTVPAVLNTSVWGDGTGGTVTASGAITWPILDFAARTVTHIVAGAIAGGAYPSAGLYQDTITVTLTYD